MKLEIIGFNIESCVAAQEAGANRIELCAGPGEGGVTPSYGFIKAAREKLHIDLYVMIRSREGDFLYSDNDLEIMENDIAACKQMGCDGIVTGILTTEGKVDKVRCRQLTELAYPMGVTFHRAFDRVADPFEALEDIIDLGFERILTSGLRSKAMDSTNLLSELTQKAGDRLIIMPGSGVNADNIIEIAQRTGAKEFHSSASILNKSKMKFQNVEMNELLDHITANKEAVKKMAGLLKAYEASLQD